MAESTRQREAFDVYWRLGGERTLRRLREQLAAAGRAPALRTLAEGSRKYHWQHRLADLERQARAADDDARIRAIREMADRQAKQALLLQQKGTEWLTKFTREEATPEAAIRAVVEGAKLERLVRGEPTERTDQTSAIDQRLEALSDAELDRLLALAAPDLAGEGETEPG